MEKEEDYGSVTPHIQFAKDLIHIEPEMEEMYGEPFQVPSPDEHFLQVGLKVEKHFDQGFYIKEAMVKFFIFAPVTKLIQPTIILIFKKLLKIL